MHGENNVVKFNLCCLYFNSVVVWLIRKKQNLQAVPFK
jgi:hypothetical protein